MRASQAVLAALPAFFICLNVVSGASIGPAPSKFEFKHHDNQELRQVLLDVEAKCPEWAKVYELPTKSVLGQPIFVIEMTDNPGVHEPLEPEFRYVANMHGNEVSGRELLLKLADYLCEQVLAGDKDIRYLLENTRIHLLPSMNPDGWDIATASGGKDYLIGRANNNSVDLNRDFPDLDAVFFDNERQHLRRNNHLVEQLDALDHELQPETRALIQMMSMYPFVLSANIHNGAVVVNYPFDKSRSGRPKEYTATPDDDIFRTLALAYSQHHPQMSDDDFPGCDEDEKGFQENDGITNGAQWYSVRGGMQDFAYLSTNDMELTLELGCAKYPPASALSGEWDENKDALINLMKMVHMGVKGLVRDSKTGAPISSSMIRVINATGHAEEPINHDVTAGDDGDYYRLLTPGRYQISAVAPGYVAQTQIIEVDPVNMEHPAAQVLNFRLNPSAAYSYDDVEEDFENKPEYTNDRAVEDQADPLYWTRRELIEKLRPDWGAPDY